MLSTVINTPTDPSIAEARLAAGRALIASQPDPEHVDLLLRWGRRFIECGHPCTPGYTFIGPKRVFKNGQWITVKEKAKLGTVSGYCSRHKDFERSPYYGWDIGSGLIPYTVEDFSRRAIWLMARLAPVMRRRLFRFNSLHFICHNSTVVDLDCYKGGYDHTELMSWIPDSVPHVITQAGGHHYYFRKTEGLEGRMAELDIDVQKNNAFVFAPPTKIRDGGSYAFTNVSKPSEFPKELPEMPSLLKGFLTKEPKPAARPRRTGISGGYSSLQLDILNDYIFRCENEDDRSIADFRACCWALKIGMDMDDFWDRVSDVGKFHERGIEYLEATWTKAESKLDQA